MISRIALLVGGIVAASVLAVALAAAGFAPSPAPSPSPVPASVSGALPQVADAAPTPNATTQVDRVYVKPAPTPKTIRIVRTAPTRPPVIVRQVTQSSGGAGGGEAQTEGNDD